MEKQNFLSKVLEKYISTKDIREFKGNFFYYIFYRIIRKFLKGNIKVRICNFFINASTNKKNMSNGLLNKCYFGDETILSVIKNVSNQKKIFFLDCGSNYGFYSFYVASLSLDNQVLAFEASPKTFNSFKVNLDINNFSLVDCIENAKIEIATAMCARVSYTVVGEEDKEPNYANDIKLHDRLLEAGHMSPFEHCGRAMGELNPLETGWSGNFKGFIQYRKTIPNENRI